MHLCRLMVSLKVPAWKKEKLSDSCSLARILLTNTKEMESISLILKPLWKDRLNNKSYFRSVCHKISLSQDASLICLYSMRNSAPSDPPGHVYLESSESELSTLKQRLVFVLLHKLHEWPRSSQTISSFKAGLITSLFTAASNFKRPVTANETTFLCGYY